MVELVDVDDVEEVVDVPAIELGVEVDGRIDEVVLARPSVSGVADSPLLQPTSTSAATIGAT